LKIAHGDEIRKVPYLPQSYAELQEVLRAMYGSTNFHVTYLDDEGDSITILRDEELFDAYESAKNRQSLKFTIKGINSTQQDTSVLSEKIVNYPDLSMEVDEQKPEEPEILIEETKKEPEETKQVPQPEEKSKKW